MFFSARDDTEDDTPSLALAMADEVQWRLAGFVQAEIERYADSIGLDKDRNDTRSETEDDQSDKEDNDGDDAEGQTKAKKKITRRKEVETESRHTFFFNRVNVILTVFSQSIIPQGPILNRSTCL